MSGYARARYHRGVADRRVGSRRRRTTLRCLPSTEALRGYDTLAIDMLMDCPDHTHENCNPWDYSAPLFLCGQTPREGCGDGQLDEAGGEACDDGNTLPGDAAASTASWSRGG